MNTAFRQVLFACLISTGLHQMSGWAAETPFPTSSMAVADARKNNYWNLGDLLALMPGVWFRDIGSVGQWATCRISGSPQDHTTLLLDGRPLTDPWSGLHDLNHVPLEMIDSIAVYPSLNPLGPFPGGGIIDLRTKRLTTNLPYTRIVYRSGDGGFSDLDITFGQKFTPKWELISGVLMKKYGENIEGRTLVANRIRSIITFRPTSKLEIRYSILHNKTDVDLPYAFPMPGDTIILSEPRRKEMRYDHSLRTRSTFWGIRSELRLDHTSTEHRFKETDSDTWKTYPAQSNTVALFQEGSVLGFPVQWGVQAHYRHVDASDSLRIHDTYADAFMSAQIRFFNNISLLLEPKVHLLPDKRLSAPMTGRIVWRLFGRIPVWGGFIQAIRIPQLSERFGFPFFPVLPTTYADLIARNRSNDMIPNESLRPERSRGFEIGLAWQMNAWFGFSTRGYIKTIDDLIQAQDTPSGLAFENMSEANMRGVETEIHFGPWHGLRSRCVINLLSATDPEGSALFERPGLWGNAAVSWEHSLFSGDLVPRITASVHFWSGFWSLTGDEVENAMLVENPFGARLNLKANIDVIKNASIFLAVDNITGFEIAFVSQHLQPRQTLRFGVTWNLYE